MGIHQTLLLDLAMSLKHMAVNIEASRALLHLYMGPSMVTGHDKRPSGVHNMYLIPTIRVNVITILHGMAAILAKISFYPSLQTDNTSSLNATFDKPKVVRCGFHLGEKLHWFTTLDH